MITLTRGGGPLQDSQRFTAFVFPNSNSKFTGKIRVQLNVPLSFLVDVILFLLYNLFSNASPALPTRCR